MRVSIIIPTLNAGNVIAELISRLVHQTVPPIEIVILDSSSDDQTIDVATELGCKTTIIKRKMFDHGGTRNLGVKLTSGEILVFMTQDAMPVDENFLENLIEPLINPKIAASFGRQVARDDAVPPEKFARLFNYPETPVIKAREDLPHLGIKTFFFSDVCSAVRREEFEMVGGFPEKIIMNEDTILAAKLILQGYKIAYVPEAKVWHSHNYGVFKQFKRYFDIGASLSMNSWVLEGYRAEGEGFRFLKEQMIYLLHRGHRLWIPYSLILAAAKYGGYRLGLLEHKLPKNLKKFFSLHTNFWN